MAHGMMVDALIFLGAAVVCVPIASRLKLGSVLGYLIAGCIIGPQALKLVADPHAIMEFAELGVVLMLFVIGLELDPRRLWELRRVVFVGGALQLVSTAGALTLGGLAVGLPWQASLIASLALSLSSTAIAMQTMSEKNLSGAAIGRAAFGVLLFQDLAAVPIMSLVPLLAPAGSVEPFQWINLGKGVLAILLVVGVGRYATRPLLNIAAQTHMREIFTAISLLLVLGIAHVMALAGLSMALGAFLAGVLLAGSEYRRALETDIEPFKGLLMGLFFIAVGMSIDFALLAAKPALVLGLLVGFQLLKLGALRAITPKFEIAGTQRLLFASLLAQGGEFAFVVFGVARASNALPSDYEGVLTLVVALSMALTPFLIILCDRLAANQADDQARAYDEIENEDPQVIIAGFGRFGQIVGRLLLATGHRATVLDHDPDSVQTLRKFGFRVFYGDATRMDLLEAAGIAHAKLLINAIDDQEDSLELVDAVRERFPKLPILARARNVTHYYELHERGVELIERETFESALALGRHALVKLGKPPFEARELSDRFRRHNVKSLETMAPHRLDEVKRLTMAKAGREELEAQFERDRELRRIGVEGPAWQRDEGGT
jgi:glutathione-regulated potassium-efflux system ancillary protein KefC